MRTMHAKHDVKLATGTACRKGNAYLIDDSHPEKGYSVWTTDGKFLYTTIWANIAFDFQAA